MPPPSTASQTTSYMPFSIQKSITYIALVFSWRVLSILARIQKGILSLILFFPWPLAVADSTKSTSSTTNGTLGQPSNDTLVVSDVNSLASPFDFSAWKNRGQMIRTGTRRECFGNLSIALAQIGPVMASETAGASGALSLLPTAGALIGAPAKELWVLYKLMPLAGIFAMMLSLGGNIVPTSTSDYEVNAEKFSYGGYIASSREEREEYGFAPDEKVNGTPAEKFATRVERKSKEKVMGRKIRKAAIGVFLQLCWLGILLYACYLTAAGGVVSWACQAWYWMFFWYLCVMLSSFLENIAGVPFTRQWTLRVSRAPELKISSDAPVLVVSDEIRGVLVDNLGPRNSGEPLHSSKEPYQITEDTITRAHSKNYRIENLGSHQRQGNSDSTYKLPYLEEVERKASFLPVSRTASGLLENLEAGYNTKGHISMDTGEPWAAPRVPFYVIVSLEGITRSHATLRVVSKAISVGVFAAGTAAFASATMITISVALTVLCLFLGAGVFGRVVAMWMVSEMMVVDPVLHAVVKTRAEASDYISHILAVDGLAVELMGHVIVNGRCIARYNEWFRAARVFGVLSPAFDLSKLVQKN